MRQTRCSRHAAVSRAETASNVTTATAFVRTMRLSNLEPDFVSRLTTITARDAGFAPPNARAARSKWFQNRLKRRLQLLIGHFRLRVFTQRGRITAPARPPECP